MKSHEVEAKVESLKSEGEADKTDELFGEILEASLLSEVVEESGKAKDEEEKAHECSVCGKKFAKYQALGGHMNKHPEKKNLLRIQEYERIRQKMKLKYPFKTANTREHVPETSSYPFNNLIQLKQEMEHFQAPMDQQQISWSPAMNNSNLAGGPANYFTVMPNPSSTYVPFDAAIDGYHGLPSMDPSLSSLTSEQYNNLPTPRSMVTNALYDYSTPGTLLVSRPMSSYAMYGYSVPCTGPCCKPLNSGFNQDLQGNDEQGQGQDSLTLDWEQPSSTTPPNEQMNDSSFVQFLESLQTSEVGTEGTDVVKDVENISNPSDTYAYGSFHF